MRIGGSDYRVKPGLAIFLAISVGSVLAVFFLSEQQGTWGSLTRLRLSYGALAGTLMVAHWCFNAIRFKILVNSLGNTVSFRTSLRAFMANVFISAVTPSQTGGGPVQIYILNRAGVPIAKGFAGCLMGAVLSVFGLLTSTVAILLLKPGLRAEFGQRLAGVLTSVVIVFSILAGLFLLSVFKTALMKRLIGSVLLALTRVVRTEKRLAITKRVLGGVDQYRASLLVFFRVKRGRLALGLVFTLAAMATNAGIALALLTGLGVNFGMMNVYLAQFILFFIAYFGPTPGASGIAEFSNYWMLSSLNVEPGILGAYTLLWRLFTSFIGVAVGGLIILALIPKSPGNRRHEPDKQA